ncbi:hypothetical protein PPTG_23665 [Phytophthora nicotianae INRA-310]|uniref:Uncharacterized protein n=1 Tax=Phytophthora nicotianae (strain INRA-310) TaxID=761204 RepID=W2PV45_PHYN3|nr:hypothetical protein PPTG_23665 [Phytophthora nicotianae INRA-310]ETN04104.1 hypothetical protein PPTG_23665 [Phytophthora nicotianae INRA-310]
MIEDTTRWLEVTVQPEKDYLATAESFDSGSADIPAQVKSPTIKDLSLLNYGVKAKPNTVKSPQAKAICERAHLELLYIIRCYKNVD